MNTVDVVFIAVVCGLISIFFIVLIGLALAALKLVREVKYVVRKAEDVVDSVESATEVFRDTKGRLAFFKLVRNIIKIVSKSKK